MDRESALRDVRQRSARRTLGIALKTMPCPDAPGAPLTSARPRGVITDDRRVVTPNGVHRDRVTPRHEPQHACGTMSGTANAALHRGLELDDTTHQPTAHDGHASRRQPRRPCPRMVDADHDRFPATSSRGRPAEAFHVEHTPGRRRSPCWTVVTDGCPLPRRGLKDTGGPGRPVPRGTVHVASNRSPFACSHHIGLHPSPETLRRCRRPWAARRVHPRALRAVPEARRRPAAAGGTPSAPPQNAEAPLRHSPRSADAILLPLGGPEHHAIPPRPAQRTTRTWAHPSLGRPAAPAATLSTPCCPPRLSTDAVARKRRGRRRDHSGSARPPSSAGPTETRELAPPRRKAAPRR